MYLPVLYELYIDLNLFLFGFKVSKQFDFAFPFVQVTIYNHDYMYKTINQTGLKNFKYYAPVYMYNKTKENCHDLLYQ